MPVLHHGGCATHGNGYAIIPLGAHRRPEGALCIWIPPSPDKRLLHTQLRNPFFKHHLQAPHRNAFYRQPAVG